MNDNPAFGADLQPFMGIPSFMRLPVTRDLDGVDVTVMGVPFDSGVSYRSGARFGPRKIREGEYVQIGIRGPVSNANDYAEAAELAYAPGTGTPEVGGLSSYQLLQLVRGLYGLNLVGFDLVEVSPPYDHGDITAVLASNIVFEYLSLLALKKVGN